MYTLGLRKDSCAEIALVTRRNMVTYIHMIYNSKLVRVEALKCQANGDKGVL